MEGMQDFDAFVALYEELKDRYYSIPEKESQAHEIFSMNYLERESGAWITSVIQNQKEGKLLRFGKVAVNYAINALYSMERDLNALHDRKEEYIY